MDRRFVVIVLLVAAIIGVALFRYGGFSMPEMPIPSFLPDNRVNIAAESLPTTTPAPAPEAAQSTVSDMQVYGVTLAFILVTLVGGAYSFGPKNASFGERVVKGLVPFILAVAFFVGMVWFAYKQGGG